ncbi:MAG TPA: 3D-(3,5/4)-trihydroxycyclohexane-1,2-dione acylhydrolase (decyclizing), partial [Bdellovibrionales bacterium]|nr:3D-(3,5/4)-trihydroxycyclohexane-1,2-dione acylhydrolase (decyclizing) [Bdellovibrionales bacterium]
MNTKRITVAAAIVEFLKNQYVERDGAEHRLINGVFGIFGHGNVAGLGRSLEEQGGRDLPFFQPKNEQAMVHTAIAYSKARKGLGTFACTTSVGPGATNMVTGAATATINRLPVLLLPGDIFANRRPQPVLQQLEYPMSMDVSVNDCFKPVSRYWDRINRPEQILHALPEAMRHLANPELMGAVTICLPEDVQAEAFDCPLNFFEKRVYKISRRACDPGELRAAADLVRKARRPLIVAGGGVNYSGAEEALDHFVAQTRIPVAVTQAGKGAISDDHPYGLGGVGVTGTWAANKFAADADVVLVVGTRLSDFTTASKTQFQSEGVRFISVNVSAFDAHKHGALPLIGDARAVLNELCDALRGYRISDGYDRELMAAKESWKKVHYDIMNPKVTGMMVQPQVIRVLNDFCDEKSTIVHAAGSLPGDLHKLWKSKNSADYHSEYGYSCMGYEIAGALGVKMAQPDREVYAFLGDGSYLMMNHEIVTSLQEGYKITVLLNDNHGYQCIHNLQRGTGGKSFGNEFRERAESGRLEGDFARVDFVANAKSLGAKVFRAENETQLT